MSSEKLEFALPGVFTIGPKDDVNCVKKYAKLLDGMSGSKDMSLDKIIKGIFFPEGISAILRSGQRSFCQH